MNADYGAWINRSTWTASDYGVFGNQSILIDWLKERDRGTV